MYVCICNAVTDSHIQAALDEGANSLRDLHRQLSVGSCCGKCVQQARGLVRQHQQNQTPSAPRIYAGS